MKLSLVIAMLSNPEEAKVCWLSHVANTTPEVELIVIDNNSQDGAREWVEEQVAPHFPDCHIVHNDDNIGVVASLQQGYQQSTGDVIAFLHNDLEVREKDWDRRVLAAFESNPRLGLAGFYGSKSMTPDGGRGGSYSNLADAEANLSTRTDGLVRVIAFDGIALIARRQMLQEIGGFDQGYCYHHFYDRDLSLASHFAGWENWLIGVPCLHYNGVTANRGPYQEWINKRLWAPNGDGVSYQNSYARFRAKWANSLPARVP